MANVIKHKRGSGSDPAANNLVLGELAIRTDTGKLFTKMDSGAIAEIAGGGSDIVINTLSSSSGTGGGSATFNGSAYRFTLSAPPNVSAAQLLVSINGVIQKPVTGTGQPSEGFAVDGNDIILGDAPATGADFFILTFKSLGVSEPADNSVTSAKIVDGTIVNADINASAAIAGSKISPIFTSATEVQNSTFKITDSNPEILLAVPSGGLDSRIINDGSGNLIIGHGVNSDTPTERLRMDSSGNVGIGTSTPTDLVDILNTTNNSRVLRLSHPSTPTGAAGFLGFNSDGSTNNNVVTLGVQYSSTYYNVLNLKRSSQAVGIGTVNPTTPFHVFHATTNGVATFESGDTDAVITLKDNAGQASVRAIGNALTLNTSSSNSERMRIDSAGRVLIGTTNNTPAASNQAGIVFGDNTAGTATAGIASFCADGAAPLLLTRRVSDGNVLGIADDTTTLGLLRVNSNDFEIRSTNNMRFQTGGNNERMRIDSSGRVMIGTATNRLGETLHVLGNGIVTSSAENTNMGLFGTFGGSDLLVGTFNANNVVVRRGNTNVARFTADGFIPNGTDTAAANALDDYEEGTFTPTSNATLTSASGSYTKIGRQVTVHIRVVVASQSSSTIFDIGNLPFTASMPSGVSNGAMAGGFGYISGGSTIPQIHNDGDNNELRFYSFAAALSISSVSGKEYRFGFVYHA